MPPEDASPGYLLTCAQGSEGLLVTEIRRVWPDVRLRWVADGIALVEPTCPFEEFSRRIDAESIFVRHLAPADIVAPAKQSLEALLDVVATLVRSLPPDEPYSVQVRSRGPVRESIDGARMSIEQTARSAAPNPFNRERPRFVVSVLLVDGTAYAGVSPAALNRSSWPGGERRFRDGPERISRSEFKLLEALQVFELTLPSEGSALDLGAAPGGWTRILLDHGLRVTAVDPAALDPRIASRVQAHVRSHAAGFLPHADSQDVIVNDMRIGASESVQTMLAASRILAPGGTAVTTLKLPETGRTSRALLDEVRSHLGRLADCYTGVRARQLFHNRSEITVAMRMST